MTLAISSRLTLINGPGWRTALFLRNMSRPGDSCSLGTYRSGNGAHVWIFFSEAVPAFGSTQSREFYLVTRTMSRRHQLGMDSYDRFISKSGYSSERGIGKPHSITIAKSYLEKGNTLFLDDAFKPYSDQWSYLASLKKMPPSILENTVRDATHTGQVLGVRIGPMEDDETPWTMSPSKLSREVLIGPFPEKLNVVVSNLVYVEKTGFASVA